jgi:hypothetical protein
VLDPQQALALEKLEALVGDLTGHPGQEAKLLLRNLEVHAEVAIEHGIEQPGDAPRQPTRRVQHAVVLDQRDELSQALVELPHQETLNATLFSNSQRNVDRFISAMPVSRKATRSYWRGSSLRMVPSPNHPPARTPASVTALPGRDTVLSLMKPEATPVQASSRSPRWQI